MLPRTDPSSPHQYTIDDIQVLDDPVALVRNRPGMFLRSGHFSSQEGAVRVLDDALTCGVRDVAVARVGEWWIVWSVQDWLPKNDARRVFERIVPFPEAGQNSMRGEVLLTAFASDVITASRDGVDVIKGSADAELSHFLEAKQDIGRLIAFRA